MSDSEDQSFEQGSFEEEIFDEETSEQSFVKETNGVVNGESNLLANLNKLSKYKSKLHREDVRKIKDKDKRERRKRAKVCILLLFNFN